MMVKDVTTQKLQEANDCAITKIPVLAVEMLRNTTGVQEATEGARNRIVDLGNLVARINRKALTE